MAEPFSSRRRFAELIKAGERKLDLAAAALAVAQEEYPFLDAGPYMAQLGELARRVEKAVGFSREPLVCIGAVNRVLFEEEGFAGNENDYYDPRNSFLNEVMDRKTGIPITLSLVYLEVAWRAGLPVAGVGLPGHFIVRYLGPDRFYYIDPFHRGAFLSEEECRERVQRIYGGRMPFREDYLQPAGGFSILTRLLYNLKNIYVESKSHAKALAVIEKLVLVDPDSWDEVRDRGLVRYQLKHYAAALSDLETYLKNKPEAEDRQDLMRLAEIIGRRLKE